MFYSSEWRHRGELRRGEGLETCCCWNLSLEPAGGGALSLQLQYVQAAIRDFFYAASSLLATSQKIHHRSKDPGSKAWHECMTNDFKRDENNLMIPNLYPQTHVWIYVKVTQGSTFESDYTNWARCNTKSWWPSLIESPILGALQYYTEWSTWQGPQCTISVLRASVSRP